MQPPSQEPQEPREYSAPLAVPATGRPLSARHPSRQSVYVWSYPNLAGTWIMCVAPATNAHGKHAMLGVTGEQPRVMVVGDATGTDPISGAKGPCVDYRCVTDILPAASATRP